MNILLSNDDGYDAPGLAALLSCLDDQEHEIYVVAPSRQLSGCSHRMSYDEPVTIKKRKERHFECSGTPCDCARIGLNFLADRKIDLVISGINSGGNLGCDIYLSGTVAAAREATFFDIPSIAISQYSRDWNSFDWEKTARVAKRILDVYIDRFSKGDFEKRDLININLPELGQIEGSELDQIQWAECELDRSALPIGYQITELDDVRQEYDYDGNYHDRSRLPGKDVDVCFGGRISVCNLNPHA